MVFHPAGRTTRPDRSSGARRGGRVARSADERHHPAARSRDGVRALHEAAPAGRSSRRSSQALGVAPLVPPRADGREVGARSRSSSVGVGRQLAPFRPGAGRSTSTDANRSSGPKRQIAADERPRDLEYRRYVVLVGRLRAAATGQLPTRRPFVYLDLPFNAILAVAEDDLAVLWGALGGSGVGPERGCGVPSALAACGTRGRRLSRARLQAGRATRAPLPTSSPSTRASPTRGRGAPTRRSEPRGAGALGPSPWAPWPVTSASKSSPDFDPRRPAWAGLDDVNWFFIRGLERVGLADRGGGAPAAHARGSSPAPVSSEYYEPRPVSRSAATGSAGAPH